MYWKYQNTNKNKTFNIIVTPICSIFLTLPLIYWRKKSTKMLTEISYHVENKSFFFQVEKKKLGIYVLPENVQYTLSKKNKIKSI
jgi:hypothetical protein